MTTHCDRSGAPIGLTEIAVGPELGGVHYLWGPFSTPDSIGIFYGHGIGVFGQEAHIGIGF